MQVLTTWMCLVSATSAIGSIKPSDCGTITDTFEGLPSTPEVAPEAPVEPPTPEKGLSYYNWHVNTLPDGANVEPQSGKEVISTFFFNNVADHLSGPDPSLVTHGGVSIGPELKSFTLESFYFACILATFEDAAVEASDCTLEVSGMKTNGEAVKAKEFSFTAKNILLGQNSMLEVDLGAKAGFGDLAFANFTLTKGDILNVLLLDDVTTTNKCR